MFFVVKSVEYTRNDHGGRGRIPVAISRISIFRNDRAEYRGEDLGVVIVD